MNNNNNNVNSIVNWQEQVQRDRAERLGNERREGQYLPYLEDMPPGLGNFSEVLAQIEDRDESLGRIAEDIKSIKSDKIEEKRFHNNRLFNDRGNLLQGYDDDMRNMVFPPARSLFRNRIPQMYGRGEGLHYREDEIEDWARDFEDEVDVWIKGIKYIKKLKRDLGEDQKEEILEEEELFKNANGYMDHIDDAISLEIERDNDKKKYIRESKKRKAIIDRKEGKKRLEEAYEEIRKIDINGNIRNERISNIMNNVEDSDFNDESVTVYNDDLYYASDDEDIINNFNPHHNYESDNDNL